jgi:hypothetical protein
VQQCHLRPKSTLEAPDELLGQSNLGDQHQGLPAAGLHCAGEVQIDFGLAAAGNAFQQISAIAISRLQHRRASQCLRIVQVQKGLQTLGPG